MWVNTEERRGTGSELNSRESACLELSWTPSRGKPWESSICWEGMQQQGGETQEFHWVSNLAIPMSEQWLGKQPLLIIEFSGMWGSFLSASLAPYLHYLISEIMRSQAIKHFDTCWQTASHHGTALLSTWIHNFELSCSSLAPPGRCFTPPASVGSHIHGEIFAQMVLGALGSCILLKIFTELTLPIFKAASEMGILPSSLYTQDLTPPKPNVQNPS